MIDRICNQVAVNSSVLALSSQQRPVEEVSVVIPTYRRGQVLIDTLEYLLTLAPAPLEILVLDQTLRHEDKIEATLQKLERDGPTSQVDCGTRQCSPRRQQDSSRSSASAQ